MNYSNILKVFVALAKFCILTCNQSAAVTVNVDSR